MSERYDTLEDVLIGVLMKGADRGALVRPPQDGKEPGVCVLVLSGAAMQRLGPPLVEVIAGLGDAGLREIGTVDEHIGLGPLFDLAEKADRGWAWFEMPFGTLKVVATVFIGRAICEKVAAICTANGAPCSLDPTKPAPGWELIGRQNG